LSHEIFTTNNQLQFCLFLGFSLSGQASGPTTSQGGAAESTSNNSSNSSENTPSETTTSRRLRDDVEFDFD
jgi:hypothetical protein